MARRYVPLLQSTFYFDADFRQLTPGAQRMYIVLLSDPHRSMIGVLPYRPRAWAATSTFTGLDDVDQAISELSSRRYVIVDMTTDEVLIRTVVKHDPPRGAKLITAMWRAWERVQSELLQRAVLDEISAEVWLMDPMSRPAEVDRLRNTRHD